MKRTSTFLGGILLLSGWLLQSCASRSQAHMILYNDSDRETPIRLSITKNEKRSPNKIITHTLKPGLQEVEIGKFTKGAYSVTAETQNGEIFLTKPLSLDTERWIILNYTNGDSLAIQKKYGYVDTLAMKKIDGRYIGIDMYSENRRPPSL